MPGPISITKQSCEELFELASFWGLYVSVMLMFISLLSLGIVSNKNIKGQNLFSTLILPVSLLGILLGIILFFFVAKLKLAFVLIPYIILVGIIVIGFVTGFVYQNHLDNLDVYYQTAEIGKVDQGGGGTIAYILGNENMNVIDAGVAVLCMHAPNEIVSKVDVYEAYRAYKVFLQNA